MKSKSQKKEELKQIKEKFPGFKIVVFTTFSRAGEKGLSVSQMSELKRALRSMGSEYLVAKKSLMNLVLKKLNLPVGGGGVDVFGMEGSVGLAFGSPIGEASEDSYYAVAKKLYEFSKKNPALRFFGAFVDGSFVDTDRFMEIANMPSREVLVARLLGMMASPLTSLSVVLTEISKKQQLASQLS